MQRREGEAPAGGVSGDGSAIDVQNRATARRILFDRAPLIKGVGMTELAPLETATLASSIRSRFARDIHEKLNVPEDLRLIAAMCPGHKKAANSFERKRLVKIFG